MAFVPAFWLALSALIPRRNVPLDGGALFVALPGRRRWLPQSVRAIEILYDSRLNTKYEEHKLPDQLAQLIESRVHFYNLTFIQGFLDRILRLESIPISTSRLPIKC